MFWKYLRAKSAYLGHDGALPWWDMFAPIGKSDAVFTTESARDYLLQVFSGFDSQLHDMVERAFNEAWIDFFPRSGKVGGAFDCGIPAVRQSRVLTNFAGSFSDVVTLAHEPWPCVPRPAGVPASRHGAGLHHAGCRNGVHLQ